MQLLNNFCSRFFIFIAACCLQQSARAQQFVTEGAVEYEVKTNVQKTMGNSSWDEKLKEMMPKFKTAYYTLYFGGGESLYKFTRWELNSTLPQFLKRNDEENVWYTNQNTHQLRMKKNIVSTDFFVADSVRNIAWRLSDEKRIIAGYTCRKATGIIMDSVYIFAFYTDELPTSAGPCGISGLPGTILGLTIPRLYTSFIATNITTTLSDKSVIKAPENKKASTMPQLTTLLVDKTKDWFSGADAEEKAYRDQFLWNALL